ncbi:YjjG family noncanonical pyrimidine nucleotidase [Balneolales bacterium ANBcel1]|nr:YjjG family noncanonical pyrimidine nucleotidase [Balneolales bacterium ANBcel1]
MTSESIPGTSGLAGATPDFSKVAFIYFDLDDTLIDHKMAQNRGLEDLWADYPELQEIDPKKFTSVFAEVNNQLWSDYRKNRIDQSTLKRLRFEKTFQEIGVKKPNWREVDARYMEYYSRHWEWIADAREAFISLSGQFPIGVMTNGFTAVQQKKFEFFSLHRYTRHLIISEEAGFLKPDPRIFEFSAKKAGVEPSRLLYVGDSYSSDILGGSQSGWMTAWYNPDGEVPGNCAADTTFRQFSQLIDLLTPSH